MYSKELKNNLVEVHDLLENVVRRSNGKLDNGQSNVFKAMTVTIKEIKDKVENQQVLNRQLMSDFDKVLSVSTRVLDGTRIDELLWNISTELDK